MKIRTPFCYIEVEYLFLIFSFICVLSNRIRNYFISFYMCYLFIIFHELAHILVASIFGKKLEVFKLSLSGVNAKFEREKYKDKDDTNYWSNVLIYFAGPFSNFILALLFHNNSFILETNLSLAIINIIPTYPLDGYNILKNTLGKWNNDSWLYLIENITIIVLISIAVYQLIYVKSITILLFTIYILILKSERKNCQKSLKYRQKIHVKKMLQLNDKNITNFK